MGVEYLMLLISLAVLVVVIVVHAVASNLQYGVPMMAGNRDALGPPSPFVARAKRCADNHIENIVLFAPLVLIAGQIDAFSPMTALGAQLFAGGRVAHAALYLFGVPWVRSLAFAVSLTGAALVALALFKII
jgi:uncharacterized MAPEG superfamily protein